MTLNHDKTVYATSCLCILGYCVSRREIKSHSSRLEALWELLTPASLKSQQRALEFFAYYAKCVSGFSDKIHILKTAKSFPLYQKQLNSFLDLNKGIASATLSTLDEASEFVIEFDASDVAVSAALNQNGRPVAFMFRAFHGGELRYPVMEKEATSIIEAMRKWAYFLLESALH